ncbi:MAG: DsrE family protein [Longilinea sp.]|nr:DsrE family protein [Longilinea sp.]
MSASKSIVFLITNSGMGNTDHQDLRERLAGTFLSLLAQTDNLPAAICFYTEGVRLACEGSPVLAQLHHLEQLGVRLILCQTCLNTLQLVDKVRIGIIGGMGDILTAMMEADSVITI